jgi:hypothetical protein
MAMAKRCKIARVAFQISRDAHVDARSNQGGAGRSDRLKVRISDERSCAHLRCPAQFPVSKMQRQLLAHVGRPALAAGADDDAEEEEEEDDEGAGDGLDQGGDSGSGSESAGEDSGADPDAAQPAGAANETGAGEGAAAAPGRTASDVTVAGGAPVFMSAVLETLVRVCRARSNRVHHARRARRPRTF